MEIEINKKITDKQIEALEGVVESLEEMQFKSSNDWVYYQLDDMIATLNDCISSIHNLNTLEIEISRHENLKI